MDASAQEGKSSCHCAAAGFDEQGDLENAARKWARIYCDQGTNAKDIYVASLRRGDHQNTYLGLGSYGLGSSFVFNETIDDVVREAEFSVGPRCLQPARAWVAAHELGHQFGLRHHHPAGYMDCVMQDPFDTEPPVKFWTLRCGFCVGALDTIRVNADSVRAFVPPQWPPEKPRV